MGIALALRNHLEHCYFRDHLQSSEFHARMKTGESSELQQEADDGKNEKEIQDLHLTLKEYKDELEQTKE